MWAGQSNNQSASEEASLPEELEPGFPVLGRSSGAAAARRARSSGQRRRAAGGRGRVGAPVPPPVPDAAS